MCYGLVQAKLPALTMRLGRSIDIPDSSHGSGIAPNPVVKAYYPSSSTEQVDWSRFFNGCCANTVGVTLNTWWNIISRFTLKCLNCETISSHFYFCRKIRFQQYWSFPVVKIMLLVILLSLMNWVAVLGVWHNSLWTTLPGLLKGTLLSLPSLLLLPAFFGISFGVNFCLQCSYCQPRTRWC